MSLKVRTILALCCAALAIAIVAGYTASVRNEAAGQRAGALERYGGETASVCVASRDIARGEMLGERNVEVVEWLVDLLPEGAVTDPSVVAGKAAASSIAANTPIAQVDIESSGNVLEVPAGLVAVSVPCSSESAVGGALVPGSVADIYVVTDGTARLLCREVQVLQTNAAGTTASLSWATVALDPSDVEVVVAASSVQRLHFALPSEEELHRRARDEVSLAAEGNGGVGGAAAGDVDAVDPVSYEGGGFELAEVPEQGDDVADTSEELQQ